MKIKYKILKHSFFFNLLVLCAVHSTIKSNENTEYNSGILTYKITADYESGSEIFLFKNNKTFKHKKIIKTTDNSISETIEINDGKFFFVIDMINKTGIKYENPSIFNTEEDTEEIKKEKREMIQSFKEEIKPVLNQSSNVVNEDIIFFGKPCKVIKNIFSTSYVWNKFTLRHEITFPIKRIKEITNIQMNALVSDMKFIPPSDITFKDIDKNVLFSLIQAKNENNK